jgi:hypothetical protein
MEKKEKRSDFPIHALSIESNRAILIKTMTQEAIREENKKLGETRCQRDKIWSMLANQVIGSEHIRE